MATGTLTRPKQKVKATGRPDNNRSDTKRDTHVSPEDGQEVLLEVVKARWTEYEEAGQESFLWVVSLGEALDALKTAVKNGQDNADTWRDFVEREQEEGNLHFGVRQADRYISIARRYKEHKIEFEGGCIDFSFGNGGGGGNGGGEKLGEVTLGSKGSKEWGGAARWTANGRLTLTWINKELVEGLAESVDEDSRPCESAVKIGAMAFSLVAAHDMDVSNKVLGFLTELEQEVAEEAAVEEA